jgi:hypothetical protein
MEPKKDIVYDSKNWNHYCKKCFREKVMIISESPDSLDSPFYLPEGEKPNKDTHPELFDTDNEEDLDPVNSKESYQSSHDSEKNNNEKK